MNIPRRIRLTIFVPILCLFADAALSDTDVEVYSVSKSGVGESIGKIKIRSNNQGLVFEPSLTGLTPGLHGFHVHENGSCDPKQANGKTIPAGAAGSHLDLDKANQHLAPWEDGHTGDLPALFVKQSGQATQPVFAPSLKMKQIKGKAIIIHEAGDNYQDDPKPLGGGGARVACGII